MNQKINLRKPLLNLVSLIESLFEEGFRSVINVRDISRYSSVKRALAEASGQFPFLMGTGRELPVHSY